MLYPSSFPIDPILPDLKEAVAARPAVVLQAPPGSGKTTRTPLALLEVIPPEKGRILMLEPRRLGGGLRGPVDGQDPRRRIGGTLGYSIRFESRVSEKTRIEVVTEGILTRRIRRIPLWKAWPWSSSTSSTSGASRPTSPWRSVSTSAAP